MFSASQILLALAHNFSSSFLLDIFLTSLTKFHVAVIELAATILALTGTLLKATIQPVKVI